MTREQAKQLAVDVARAVHSATGSPSYYAEPFTPHEWVIEAVLAAASSSFNAQLLERLDAEIASSGRIEHALVRIAEALENR